MGGMEAIGVRTASGGERCGTVNGGANRSRDAPLVEATSAKMVRPLMRSYPDTLHLQAGSGRRSSQSRASVSACHAQALVCEG
jgi:hypothetical protein